METTTLSIENIHIHGALFADVLRAKDAFANSRAVDAEATTDFFVGDQYDTPASKWIAVHAQGAVLGGLRLTPSVHKCGVYSYQLRDAQNGILEAIEDDPLYSDAPIDAGIWEAGPIFIDRAATWIERNTVLKCLTLKLMSYAADIGAHTVLALIPETWKSVIERFGCDVSFVGPTVLVGGRKHRAVSINLNKHLH